MSRLAPIHPKDMTEEQMEYSRSIRKQPTFQGKPDDRPLIGPFVAYQRAVPYDQLKNAMSRYLRHDGLLPPRRGWIGLSSLRPEAADEALLPRRRSR